MSIQQKFTETHEILSKSPYSTQSIIVEITRHQTVIDIRRVFRYFHPDKLMVLHI